MTTRDDKNNNEGDNLMVTAWLNGDSSVQHKSLDQRAGSMAQQLGWKS
jgi:hypothetical protein